MAPTQRRNRKNTSTYHDRKKIACPHCSQSFSCIFNRDQHVRGQHTGERPFECHCGKSYGRRWLLLRHQRIVHDTEDDDEDVQVIATRSHPAKAVDSPSTTINSTPNIHPSTTLDSTAASRFGTAIGSTVADSAASMAFGSQRIRYTSSELARYRPRRVYYCETCREYFERFEQLIVHRHLHHGRPPTVACACEFCRHALDLDSDMVGSEEA